MKCPPHVFLAGDAALAGFNVRMEKEVRQCKQTRAGIIVGGRHNLMLSYWDLWAKTTSHNRWHALPYHLLDVAATAETLWNHLPIGSRFLPSQALGGEAAAKRICIFLAAIHDVGKANRFFQAKDRYQYDRLRKIHDGFPPYNFIEPKRHGQATGAYLKPWCIDHWNWKKWTAETVALAVGGHHGTFFAETKKTSLQIECEPWRVIGNALLDALSDVLLKESDPPNEPCPLNPFLGWLSGFVSVADWLGSNESMTVWESGGRPLPEYLNEARSRANQLFSDLNWQSPPQTPKVSVAELLPVETLPNTLQQIAESIAPDFSLAIVEAPTGEGKTEAAFGLAEPARSNGAGVFFALPTMATANGLHDRVNVYLKKATRDEDLGARLLHSQAWLFRDTVKTAQNPGNEGWDQARQAQDWFSGAKRGLLAPFGVGTIDQILIAALRAKHGFVRLFALAGKTVVIDEVHAYDVYMADLMNVLLGWLRALGCKVILLSATLPKTRRNALLRAWGLQDPEPQCRYPAITWITDNGQCDSRHIEVKPRKPLFFKTISAAGNKEPWEIGATQILEAIQNQDGLGALVLNTVGDAQQAYDWLLCRNPDNVELMLFHSRYTAHDRKLIEKRVLERFGRSGVRTKPAILVATQVVEQSLDLDFDYMVSSLAPIDLLIQRAGRLHRHRRRLDGCLWDGDDQRSDPVLYILAPHMDEEGLPDIQDPVYSRDILMRTLHRLQHRPRILQPSDVSEAIDAVYGESDRENVRSAWEHRLSELEAKTAKKTAQEKKQAERATIGAFDDEDELIVEAFLDLDENDERQGSQLAARTRLEDRPSISIALMREDLNRLITIHGADATDPRGVLFSSVRISPPYSLWEAILELEPPSDWNHKGSLSQTRPLVLEGGRTKVGNYQIQYDEQLGLNWRKTNVIV